MMQVETHSGAGSLAPTSDSASSFMHSHYLSERRLVGKSVFVKRGSFQGRVVIVAAELPDDRLGVYLDGQPDHKRVIKRSEILQRFDR